VEQIHEKEACDNKVRAALLEPAKGGTCLERSVLVRTGNSLIAAAADVRFETNNRGTKFS
jgi:hypothetical protein